MNADVNIELFPGERLDDLQQGKYRLIQKQGTFCFGTDSVLLADFAAPRKRERVADLGCGNGAIALLMAAHREDITVEAVEIQPEMADMARRSVALNGVEHRVHVHNCDMRVAWELLGRERCALAVCNPPYSAEGAALLSESEAKRIARHEGSLTPDDVAKSAAAILKFGGRFCVVFPAPRAYEMMAAMDKHKLAPKRIRTVHASSARAPKLVLIEAVKGGGNGLHWLEPLVLSEDDGMPTAEWKRIYGVEDEKST